MTFTINDKSVALILAAGFGTRLQPLTFNTPKPLIEIGGCTMLERASKHLVNVGFKNIVINTHYLSHLIDAIIPRMRALFPNVNFYISYEPDILDVGGAIKKVALEHNASELFIYNSDILIIDHTQPFKAMIKAWQPNKMSALLYLKDKQTVFDQPIKGDFNLDVLNRLKRAKEADSNKYIYTGISIFKTSEIIDTHLVKFNIMKDYLFSKLIKQHTFYGIIADFDFIDIGTHKSLQHTLNIFK